ncbi:hypothetical protein [Leifsonia xyli]|uniref:hypothetical protein n=1 Tax=Leifsonia xyli TaxID=1575 RepID=UPI003D67FAD8
MRVRVVSPVSKAAYVVVVFALVILVTVPLGAFWPALGALCGTAVVLTAVIVAARCFRGEDEPVDPPRPWWKMADAPAAGFVWAVLFAVGGVSNIAAQGAGLVTGCVSLTIAAAYAASAVWRSSCARR